MLRDKLNENVARVTWPLVIAICVFVLKVNVGGIVMMTDSKSDEPEDLIEPLPGNNRLIIINLLIIINY